MANGQPHVDGVEHRDIDVQAQDGPLRVHLAEAGEGPPVLLLHGWPQHWFERRHVVPLLAAHRRLLMPDMRGFGWTQAPGRGYDGPTLASDAVALLDALGLERVHLVGHDWGAHTAFLAALRFPERFERVLAINAPPPWRGPLSPALLPQSLMSFYAIANATPGLGPWLHRRSLTWVAWNLRRCLVNPEAIRAGEMAIFARRFRDPERARAAHELYRYYQRSFADVLFGHTFDDQRLTVPTLLLWGERDCYLRRELARSGEGHGDFTLEYVPDTGHFLPEERPELVAQRVLEA